MTDGLGSALSGGRSGGGENADERGSAGKGPYAVWWLFPSTVLVSNLRLTCAPTGAQQDSGGGRGGSSAIHHAHRHTRRRGRHRRTGRGQRGPGRSELDQL